jgi:hypothetical protein
MGNARSAQNSNPSAATFLPVTKRIRLAPDFGKRFIIFSDAEEEFDWNGPFKREQTATKTIAELIPATARFNAAGVHPVYLCDFPVVDNVESASIIRDLVSSGACDVGTQLHPWVNPPHDELVTPQNSFTGNLPVALQRAKLITLTEKITEATGIRPTVYRAGRYGIGPATMTLLAEQGYLMDVSVRAQFDYSAQSGPDYSTFPVWPWRTEEGVIELPLSAVWTGGLRAMPALFKPPILRGILSRSRLLTRVPLTPEGVRLGEALTAIKRLYDEGLDIFSLSFHTPSLTIGHTPYVRSQHDLDLFWAWWDGVFNLFAKLGVTPARYSDIVAATRAS